MPRTVLQLALLDQELLNDLNYHSLLEDYFLKILDKIKNRYTHLNCLSGTNLLKMEEECHLIYSLLYPTEISVHIILFSYNANRLFDGNIKDYPLHTVYAFVVIYRWEI